MTPRDAFTSLPAKVTALVSALAAGGWLIISPTQQLRDLSAKFDAWAVRQDARDVSQDARLELLKQTTDSDVRALREDVSALLIGQCVAARRARDATMIEVLGCGTRVAR